MMSLKLPKGWVLSSFDQITSYVQRGKSPKYSELPTYPVVNQKCVRWHGLDLRYLKYIQEEQWNSLTQERFLQEGDLLWNSTGTGTIGRACLFRKACGLKTVVDSHVTIVRLPKEFMVPEYLFYYVMSPFIQKEIENMQSGSTNQVELGRSVVLSKNIPVAPFNEQKRIVDKIERLFSKLDEGEALLKQVQQQLAIYRQSVLKAAVTGELTKDWRESNQHRLESGEALLQRILEIRRQQWQRRGKYKEPEHPSLLQFFPIPTGWVPATVDQLSKAVEYGSSAKCSAELNAVPVLRMGNIQEGKLDIQNLKYLPSDHHEFPKLLLSSGDLLFNRTNSAELVGKTAVYQGKPQLASFASYLIRVRFIKVTPEYISAYINSMFGRSWIKSVVSQQVGQANVNGAKLKALTLPLPPIEEQKEIIQRVDSILSQIDALETWCATELVRSASLRQSILKDAFSGKLVEQDPNDEPASELLKRIQAAKAAVKKAPARKRQ